MTPEKLTNIQNAIREEGLDGWLFCNFRHRDRLADEILDRPESLTNSRYWFYAVPASGEPAGIIHAIETDHLEGLPGTKQPYVSREELRSLLAPWKGKRWGAHFSETLSAVSFMEAGIAAFLKETGLTLVSAAPLIQRFKGLLEGEAVNSHERASAALYEIVEAVWEYVRASWGTGKPIYEGDLRQIMEDEFLRRGLTRDHPPLAAGGVNTGNPHYDFAGSGAAIKEGDLIQLDLWAKEKTPGAVYADISWVGVYGKTAPEAAGKIFADLALVRDKTFRFIEERLVTSGGPARLSGAEVDAYTRRLLFEGGYEKYIKHRTGHGIDTEVHGSGVNIDSVEFPDPRLLLNGSCFSLEPGIYYPRYGFRTEIDVYISGGRPVMGGAAAGKKPQTALLHC